MSNLALLRERPGAQLIPGRFELHFIAKDEDEEEDDNVNAKESKGSAVQYAKKVKVTRTYAQNCTNQSDYYLTLETDTRLEY